MPAVKRKQWPITKKYCSRTRISRRRRRRARRPWKILIVDDEEDVPHRHGLTCCRGSVTTGADSMFLHAYSAAEARKVLSE
jgi:hypothetical protein